LRIGTSLGVCYKTHAKCLKVRWFIPSVRDPTAPEANCPVFRPQIAPLVTSGHFRDAQNGNGNGSTASRETAERIQIYERLSMPSYTQTDLLMEQIALFNVPVKEKKKKFALAEAICE
jgi:hypothetical protein